MAAGDFPPRRPIVPYLFIATAACMIFAKSIHPLIKQAEHGRARLADLHAEIDGTRLHLSRVAEKERQVAENRADRIRQREAGLKYSSLAFVSSHFARYGLGPVATRVNSDRPDTDSADYVRSYWAIQLAVPAGKSGTARALAAITDLCEAEPMLEMIALDLRPDPNESTGRLMVATISTVTHK